MAGHLRRGQAVADEEGALRQAFRSARLDGSHSRRVCERRGLPPRPLAADALPPPRHGHRPGAAHG
eukprot:8611536-Alexandrium_andersonii.AAC.1